MQIRTVISFQATGSDLGLRFEWNRDRTVDVYSPTGVPIGWFYATKGRGAATLAEVDRAINEYLSNMSRPSGRLESHTTLKTYNWGMERC